MMKVVKLTRVPNTAYEVAWSRRVPTRYEELLVLMKPVNRGILVNLQQDIQDFDLYRKDKLFAM